MSSFSLQQRDGGIHGWIAGLSCLVEDGKTLSESARDMWNGIYYIIDSQFEQGKNQEIRKI